MGFLDQYYSLPSPPADVVDLFVDVLPRKVMSSMQVHSVAADAFKQLGPQPEDQCSGHCRLAAFQMAVVKQDTTVLQMFVKEDLLKKFSEPPTQQSHHLETHLSIASGVGRPICKSKAGRRNHHFPRPQRTRCS